MKAGLRYLEDAIDEAVRLADGWFISANLMEYLDLGYQALIETGDPDYRARIDARFAVWLVISSFSLFIELNQTRAHLGAQSSADAQRQNW